jgi:glycosyltransferase involved in cell wall biosynthesis
MTIKQVSSVSTEVLEGSLVCPTSNRALERPACGSAASLRVCLLTGGGDRPYALGMASALVGEGISVDFIGSDELDVPQLHQTSLITFLNLRGGQTEDAPFYRKVVRVLIYYARLVKYVVRSEARIFHILWNNRFEHFDRTLLMLYYRLFRKRIILTAHNVNTRKRDGRDSWFNRFSLGIQYRLCHHILVHTTAMKNELVTDFGLASSRVTVIPFGINNTCPSTALGRREARQRLGLASSDRTLLFFGRIAPYKGLGYLIAAMSELVREDKQFCLVIAGRVKCGYDSYWNAIQNRIAYAGLQECIIQHVRFIPDEEVELYFKAADVAVIPYTEIFQSGVPFLSYSFGLPVIATDVGSLRHDIFEGRTGFVCRPKDSSDLARTIDKYFKSDLFRDLENRRSDIKRYANERYSWDKVAAITTAVYSNLISDVYLCHLSSVL